MGVPSKHRVSHSGNRAPRLSSPQSRYPTHSRTKVRSMPTPSRANQLRAPGKTSHAGSPPNNPEQIRTNLNTVAPRLGRVHTCRQLPAQHPPPSPIQSLPPVRGEVRWGVGVPSKHSVSHSDNRAPRPSSPQSRYPTLNRTKSAINARPPAHQPTPHPRQDHPRRITPEQP